MDDWREEMMQIADDFYLDKTIFCGLFQEVWIWWVRRKPMTDLTPEAVKAALQEHDAYWIGSGEVSDLENMAPDLARECLRLWKVEEAAQWVVDNPKAHPDNISRVIRAAVGEE